ncbi:MAG: tripartite tricarboxylate transporter substrate binding protein [Hyphomicrobiales bacterium]
MKTTALKVLIGALAIVAAGCGPSFAQKPYPSQLTKLVVSFPPGSTVDLIGRVLADSLSRRWGMPVIVENVAGAAGQLGTGRVAQALPDGHTLLVSPPAQLVTHHVLYKTLPYDPRQFVPITVVAQVPHVLGVRKDFVTSLADFISYAKANPGKLTYASQGVGSTTHLTTTLFARRANIDMLHVPYRGTAPALNDLISGNIDSMFDNVGTALPLHRAGRIRILATANTQRLDALPDIPTIEESGFAGFRSVTWYALVAPRATPDPIVEAINNAVAAILLEPDVRRKLEDLSLQPAGGTTRQAAQFFKEETAVWSEVIKNANVEVQ